MNIENRKTACCNENIIIYFMQQPIDDKQLETFGRIFY